MTIAPDNFNEAQIRYLIKKGVILSLGHSNCNYDKAVEALSFGTKSFTHLFNAMSGLTGRDPGMIGAALNNECYVGVICDLLHVAKPNI